MQPVFAPGKGKNRISLLRLDSQEMKIFIPFFYYCAIKDGITSERNIVEGNDRIIFEPAEDFFSIGKK